MNMQKTIGDADRSRSGVALIIVLGFLSVMILMAVAFLTQARTERLVANSSMEAQRGRQLVRTGLNAAMNDYSIELWSPDRFMLPPPGLDVFTSYAPTAGTDMGRVIGDDNIYLMMGEARRWLPRRYLTEAVTNLVADAEWILVREDPSDSHSRILGRYAYACFDMSGGIDANLIALASGVAEVGNHTNRHSIREVGMGELPETANVSEFKRLRRGWHGFDNLAEVKMLTNGKYNGGENSVALTYKGVKYYYSEEDSPEIEDIPWPPISNPRWRGDRLEKAQLALLTSEVSDLVPYSLAAYRGVWNWGGGFWSAADVLACEDSSNWSSAEWTQLLDPVSAQINSVPDAVKALQDYVDPSAVPFGVNYPSSKNIPMFNEMQMSFELRHVPAAIPGNPDQMFLDVELEFETWYPFLSADNPDGDTYTIQMPTISGGSQNPGPGDIIMRAELATGERVTLPVSSSTPGTLSVTSDQNSGNPKRVAGTAVYNIEIVPVDPATIMTPATELRIRGIRVNNPIQMVDGGSPVDQMDVQDIVLADPITTAAATVFSMEVNDPRLNHVKDNWTKTDTPTLDDINSSSYAEGYGDPGGEGLFMYCRNGAMETPGEIGFISTGRPWETIDLCTVEGAEMLAAVVSSTNTISALKSASDYHTFYTNGTINPNTSSSNVLHAAFADLYMREMPNIPDRPGPEDGPISENALNDLADSILNATQSKKIESLGIGAFMSGSDWVRVDAMGVGGDLSSQGLNKNQRETLIRSTWDLFSPNNSMFTVLVVGQAIKEGPGQVGIWDIDEDIITGERRGVALIWRDPTPSGAEGHHEMFVRMFKFLDE